MNTFLQGCCFVPPEDEISTPSFIELTPHLVPLSRSSSWTKPTELTFVKDGTASETWNDETNCSISKASFNDFKTVNSSRTIRLRRKGSSTNSKLVPPGEDFKEQPLIYLCKSTAHSHESSSYLSTYGSCNKSQRTTSRSKILDFISLCFWKCSPGCQQIPTINT